MFGVIVHTKGRKFSCISDSGHPNFDRLHVIAAISRTYVIVIESKNFQGIARNAFSTPAKFEREESRFRGARKDVNFLVFFNTFLFNTKTRYFAQAS